MDIGATGCNLLRPLPPGCVRGLAGSTKNNKLCTDQLDERCSCDLCIRFPPQLTTGLDFPRLFPLFHAGLQQSTCTSVE